MNLHGGFPLLKLGPGKDGEAKADEGRIEGIRGLAEFHAEVLVGVERPGGADERLSKIGVDAPVAGLVGMGQGVSGDLALDSEMIEFGRGGPEAGLDVPQADRKSVV